MRIQPGASIVAGFFALIFSGATIASAQPLNELPPARAPCSVLSGRPCHPSFCGVFHRGPCFPQYLPPIGQDLRLTIVSTDDTSRQPARLTIAPNPSTKPHQKRS